MTVFKVGLCLTAATAIAGVFYVPRRRMLGQLALMCVILSVLAFGFASPLGPVKFMGAMAGAFVLAVLYAVKARSLLLRMASQNARAGGMN